MPALFDWLPLAMAGVLFTALGAFKLYGVAHDIRGGHSKPFTERLCGT